MADSDVQITAGSGTKIDTRTVGVGTDEHRQVIIVGDPSTASAVASVTAAEGLDVDVTRLPVGENHIGEVGGRSRVITASFTRPADVTAYAAGDAVTDSTTTPTQITFNGIARINDGSGVIVNAALIDSVNAATKGQFELWLFDASVTPNNDNSAFAPSDADAEKLIGVIQFSIAFAAGNNAAYTVSGLSIPFKCSGGIDDIFGLLVVRNAYTPVSAEKFTIRLGVLQD